MLELPQLEVINQKRNECYTTFQDVIEKRILLKTKLKVLQIEAIERDLRILSEANLGLDSLELDDFCLTKSYNLFVPIASKLKPRMPIPTLDTYFIYLSYLYNTDFKRIYEQDKRFFYELLSIINIPMEIKKSFIKALRNEEVSPFSVHTKDLHSHEFRERLQIEERRLRQLIKM